MSAAWFPWQAPQWRRIRSMLAAGRLPHGLILAGPDGLGKRHFAHIVAAMLLCESRTGEGLACGRCRACALYAAGNHPDAKVVVPEEEGKAIAVDQIRELGLFAALKSHGGGWQIAIIAPADAMNRSAANALLKTLEEPPPGMHLLLIAEQPSRLPATVRSRCQTLLFRSDDTAMAWLSSQTPATERGDLQAALAMSRGAPLASLRLLQENALSKRFELLEQLDSIRARRAEPITVATDWVKKGTALALSLLRLLMMETIKFKMMGGSYASHAFPDLTERLKESAKRIDLQALFMAYDTVETGWRLLGSGTNVREQDVMESIAIAWARQPVAD